MLDRLVQAGNTVVVIEHNLDVIKTADRIIDMGPEGGEEGGLVVAHGTPEQVAGTEGSYTGRFLAEIVEPKVRKSRRRLAPRPRSARRSRSWPGAWRRPGSADQSGRGCRLRADSNRSVARGQRRIPAPITRPPGKKFISSAEGFPSRVRLPVPLDEMERGHPLLSRRAREATGRPRRSATPPA